MPKECLRSDLPDPRTSHESSDCGKHARNAVFDVSLEVDSHGATLSNIEGRQGGCD